LIAVVVRLLAPPPITTEPEVRLSTCKAERLAVLPDTITFFQVAINYCFGWCLLYICYSNPIYIEFDVKYIPPTGAGSDETTL
jgi:hypothetical protein